MKYSEDYLFQCRIVHHKSHSPATNRPTHGPHFLHLAKAVSLRFSPRRFGFTPRSTKWHWGRVLSEYFGFPRRDVIPPVFCIHVFVVRTLERGRQKPPRENKNCLILQRMKQTQRFIQVCAEVTWSTACNYVRRERKNRSKVFVRTYLTQNVSCLGRNADTRYCSLSTGFLKNLSFFMKDTVCGALKHAMISEAYMS